MRRGYINIFFLILLTFTSMHGMEGALKKDESEASPQSKSMVIDREFNVLKTMKDNPEAPHEPSILDYVKGMNKCRFIWALMSNNKFRSSDAYPLMQKLGAVGKKEAEDMLEELFEVIQQREFDDTAYTKIKCLINGVDLEREYGGYTSLHWAALKQNIPALQLILDQNISPSINAQDKYGKTVLHYFVMYLSIVRPLVEHNADVNIKDHEGYTPLHIASYNSFGHDNIAIIDCLVKAGADIFAKDNNGKTPIDIAKEGKCAASSIIAYFEAYLEEGETAKEKSLIEYFDKILQRFDKF